MADINVTTFSNAGRAQQPAPSAGKITLSTRIDFTGLSVAYVLDPTAYILSKAFWPQAFGLFIDNSNGANEIIVEVEDTRYTFPVPSYTAGWFPAFATPGSKYRLSSAGGSTTLTSVLLCNWEQVPFTYSGFAPFHPGESIQAFPPSATTVNSRNTIIGAGVATIVFPSTTPASQKSMTNYSQDDMWYNLNTTATGNPANGDQLLQAGQTIVTPFAWGKPISIYSAAGGQVIGYDWS